MGARLTRQTVRLPKNACDANVAGIYIHHILSSDVTKKEKPWFSNCNTPKVASMNVNGLTGGTGFLSTGEDSAAVRNLAHVGSC
jgi:hypothetical protein